VRVKFKKLAMVAIVAGSMLALAGCSSNKNKMGPGGSMPGDENGAQAAGIGENENFGGDSSNGSAGSMQLAQKNTYYFDFDSSDVRQVDRPRVDATGNSLVSHPHKKVIVEGHTDPRGSREYNVALGERRANSVADILRSKGVNGHQARVVSYGAERLAVEGNTEQAFQADRRVVIADQ